MVTFYDLKNTKEKYVINGHTRAHSLPSLEGLEATV